MTNRSLLLGCLATMSLVAAVALPTAVWFTRENMVLRVVTIALGVLAILKHRKNIQRLLAGTRTPIAEIADICGFTARRSFYRAFHRWTGQTPAEFRRRAQTDLPQMH